MRITLLFCLVVALCGLGCGSDGEQGPAGADGATTLVSTTAEPSGDNCEDGGVRIEAGTDENGDGSLDKDEVLSTSYVCNGPTGDQGAEGLTSLVATSDEPAGTNCTEGGVKIEGGIDDDESGTLEPGEVDQTRYVCNGDDGLVSLTNVSDEPAGANCQEGGIRIDWGLDDDGSGTLDAAEIEGTSYVCNPLITLSRHGETNGFPTGGDFGADFLLGIAIDVPQDSILKGFGYWGLDDTTDFRMALYTDSGGEPDQLVAETGPIAMDLGEQEVMVSDAPLPAGTYWIMGHYPAFSPGAGQDSGGSTTIKFISLPFSSDPPQTYPTAMTYTGGNFNYWIVATP